MTQSQTWFPGKDFPDREIWLKIRTTPRNLVKFLGRLFQNKDPVDGSLQPIVIGINKAKRAARLSDRLINMLRAPGAPKKFPAHTNLVRQRHAYYRAFYKDTSQHA